MPCYGRTTLRLVSRVRSLLIVPCLLTASCGGTLGPLVTDVAWGDHGELVITRCMLNITSAANITSYTMHDCVRSVHPAPSSRTVTHSPTPVPAPSGSSATPIVQ
jgi:hypothetical protein